MTIINCSYITDIRKNTLACLNLVRLKTNACILSQAPSHRRLNICLTKPMQMSSESIKCAPATHLNVCIDRRKQAHGREACTKADDQSYLSEFYTHFKIFFVNCNSCNNVSGHLAAAETTLAYILT